MLPRLLYLSKRLFQLRFTDKFIHFEGQLLLYIADEQADALARIVARLMGAFAR